MSTKLNQMTIYINDLQLSVIDSLSERMEKTKSATVSRFISDFMIVLRDNGVLSDDFILNDEQTLNQETINDRGQKVVFRLLRTVPSILRFHRSFREGARVG